MREHHKTEKRNSKAVRLGSRECAENKKILHTKKVLSGTRMSLTRKGNSRLKEENCPWILSSAVSFGAPVFGGLK